MSNTTARFLILIALLFPAPALATDGQILINQSTVMAAGGFPYKITQPGSYKLSGNLVVSGTTDAIDIQANNVTLDLNGFTISGPIVCTATLPRGASCAGTAGDGISSTFNNIAVRNGVVRGFHSGVRIVGDLNNTVEEVRATSNSADGIRLFNGLVRRNTASVNGGSGIVAVGSVVRENVASFNAQDGIVANNSTVTENMASSNLGFGLSVVSSLYGSKALLFNTSTVGMISSVSQSNNNCDGVAC